MFSVVTHNEELLDFAASKALLILVLLLHDFVISEYDANCSLLGELAKIPAYLVPLKHHKYVEEFHREAEISDLKIFSCFFS